MKKIILLQIIVVTILVLNACKSENLIHSLSFGIVTEIRYVHDLVPDAVITAHSESVLIEVVRVVTVRDNEGNETIIIGEESDQNSAIYYTGMKDGYLTFQLVPGGESLSMNPDPNSVRMFPENSQFIELWGTNLEILRASSDAIKCRVLRQSVQI